MRLHHTVALALLATSGSAAGCSSHSQPSPSASIPVASPSVRAVASVPGETPVSGISAYVMSAALAADGSAAQPSSTFAASASRVYAVLTLNGLPAGTKLGYVRYIDGHFVDSRSAITGPNAKYFYFEFAAKDPSKPLHAGHYRLRLYLNERKAREINYTIGTR